MSTKRRPMDTILNIETQRMRLKLKKKDLAEMAGIIPEMYSYMLRRGNNDLSLPEECVAAVEKALQDYRTKTRAQHKESRTA